MLYKTKIPLYYGELRVVIADDFTKGHNLDKSVNDYKALSTCINEKDSHWAIFIHPEYLDDHGLIAHEALHIVGYLFACIKCKMDLDNDEPQCYLLAWVVGEIYNAICKYRKAVR